MNPLDFSVEELDKLFALADDIEKDPAKYAHKCDGKILATCFYEPSTRTRLSFESAMTRLGGRVIGFSDASSSSASKGESVSDTIRIISCYADICAMRHPKEGAPMVVAVTVIKGRSGFERDGSFTTARGDAWQMFDAGVASEAFCLAAYEQGLGTVIMGIFDQQEAADLLEIPENQDLIALIPIGYPAEAPVAPKRKSVTDLLSYQQ